MKRLIQACLILSTLFLTGCCCMCHNRCGYGSRHEHRGHHQRHVYNVAPGAGCCPSARPVCCP